MVQLQAPVQPTSNPSPPFHVFCVLISIMIVIADIYLIQCCLLAVVLSTSDFAYTTEPSIPEPSHPNTANTQVNRYTCSVACQCKYLISRSHGSFSKDLDLLKFKPSIRVGMRDDFSDVDCSMAVRGAGLSI